MLTAEQEQEIIAQILAGDKEQYALIVKEYQSAVNNLCYKLTSNTLDADEITQQVFIELYTALPRFRYASRLSTFIYRITVNVIAKMIKYNKRIISYKYETTESNTVDYQQPYEEQIVKNEQQRRLREAIGKLKHEQRTALVLYSFKDFSYQDIADVMQVSLSKVESLIFRAKKNLKKMLT